VIEVFANFEDFKKKAQQIGVGVDLSKLLTVDIAFLESYGEYVIISIKDYSSESANESGMANRLVVGENILILSEKDALLYSESKSFGENDYKMYRYTLQKPFGESTVLAFLTLDKVLDSYQNAFKAIDEKIDELEKNYSMEEAEQTTVRLRKLTDRVEDFVSLLISLEERKIKQVNTSLVGYDYHLSISKAQNLLDRCRNHLGQLRDIQKDVETRQAHETNKNIAELTLVMKKLASITVILLIPTAIALNYGVATRYLPELNTAIQSYYTIIIVQIALVLALLFYFQKKKWI